MKPFENCIFNEKKKCPVVEKLEKVIPSTLALFCQSCTAIGLETQSYLALREQMKIQKVSLVLGLLQLFPNDEEKAKKHYQDLLRRVNEWELKETV